MPITMSTDNLSASGLSVSGSFVVPFIPAPAPQSATYNSTYAGATSRIRFFNVGTPGMSTALEIPVPTLVDNQSYPGIPAGRVQGGNAGIRLSKLINHTLLNNNADLGSGYVMEVYTDQTAGTPASNTFPLRAGYTANFGGPSSSWLGGIDVQGMSFFNSTPIGQVGVPGNSSTVSIVRRAPQTLTTPSNATLNLDAGAPGVVAYYVRFQQSQNEKGSIWTPGTTTTYATSSDYRLKDSITPLDSEEELQRINQLRPRKWNWKTNQDPGVGFIAHEIQEVFEDATKLGMVSGSKDQVVRKGRIVDVSTGEPVYKKTTINEETGEETVEYSYIEEPTTEEAANLAADGKEWSFHHDEPIYQSLDTSFLSSSTIAAIQALTTKVLALESRVAALESV